MQPSASTKALAQRMGADLAAWESDDGLSASVLPPGIFLAGAAAGPRTIAETVASAGDAAWQAARYLGIGS
jgi:heterodisulfide reductase subunit A-like polyferredoxin